MTEDALRWLVGLSVTVILSIAGIAIGAFRAMSAKLDGAVEAIEKTMRSEDAQLHSRINEVKDKYVRRDDFDKHMDRMDRRLDEIRSDQKELIDWLKRGKERI